MKRILFIIIAMLTSMSSWAYDFSVDGIYYLKKDGSNVTVTYRTANFNSYSGNVVIPESVTYNGTTYSVTSIGNYAFSGCTGLTEVTIPNSVTSIDECAFQNCSSLTEVTIPNSVTSIGGSAFSGCTGLTEVTIGNSVTSIGDEAFYGCIGLKTLTIEDGDTELSLSTNFYPFISCKVENLYVGRNLSSWAALRNSSALKQVTIGNSVTSIGEYAFYGCSGLTEVTIPNSVTSIGEDAFRGCTGLTQVTIPNSVTSIGGSAFYGCTGLTEVTIGNSVTSIGNYAFYGCSSLKVVINYSALYFSKGYSNYDYIAYYADRVYNNVDGVVDGFVFSNASPAELSGYLNNDTELLLPDNYNGEPYVIGDRAFYNCSGLTSVTIPEGVTSIGNSAFYGCTGLTEVTIGNSVTSIGEYAFYDCTGLTEVTIPESVTSIGSYAFRGCSALTEVTIPNSVTSIGEGAFKGCSSLTEVSIPNSVTSIGSYAFSGCTGLTEVTIPNSVTSIGSSAFSGCTGLTEVTIGNSLTIIADQAFYGCTGLTEVTIGNSVTSIGEYAFYGCTGLTEVTIPNSVISIGGSAFRGCTGLTEVTIPNSVTSIGDEAFYGCTGLTEVAIPNSVTSIGGSAFYGCTGLTEVAIPNSVTSIGDSAFYGCSGLTEVAIGNSVTSIGSSAFGNCYALKLVVNHSRLQFSKRSSNYGYIAYYADRVYNNVDGVVDGFVFSNASPAELLGYLNNDTELLLPDNYKGEAYSIGSDAFYGCSDLTSLTIPRTVTSIASNALSPLTYCKIIDLSGKAAISSNSTCRLYNPTNTPLLSSKFEVDGLVCVPISMSDGTCKVIDYKISDDTEFTIPARVSYRGVEFKVESLGELLFVKNQNVTSINIEAPITEIPRHFAYNCTKLSQLTTAADITSIGDYSFYKTGVRNFADCPSLVTIGSYAMYDVDVWKVIIHEGVKSIGSYAFGCSYDPVFQISVDYRATDATTGDSSPFIGNVDSAVIADGVKTIPARLFYGQGDYIGRIEIPSSVTSVGDYAFYANSSAGHNVVVALNDGLESVGQYAFAGCTIESSYLPSTLKSVASYAFASTEMGDVVIPASITSISNYAFAGSKMSSLTIPESVTSIGQYAFNNCTQLASAVIAPSVIDQYAFNNCTQLASVVIAPSVTSIGQYAFNNCTQLASVVIPPSVTSIGTRAFADCKALVDVTLADGYEPIVDPGNNIFTGSPVETITIGRPFAIYISEELVGEGYIPGLYEPYSVNLGVGSTLRRVWITNTPSTVFNGMFSGCTNLEDVFIGSNVTAIRDNAFRGCSAIKSFTFGKNVGSIGSSAFLGCYGITNLYAEAPTPPQAADLSLDDINKWDCTLHVMPGSKDAYAASGQWKEFLLVDETMPLTMTGSQNNAEVGTTFTITINEPTRSLHTYTWLSSNPAVATIDPSTTNTAIVHIVGAGNVTIAAYNEEGQMTSTAINSATQVTGVKLEQKELTLDKGESATLTAIVTPDGVDRYVISWTSSDTSVATVDDDGTVHAVAPGTATITVTVDGTYTDRCVVTVLNNTGISNANTDGGEITIGVERGSVIITGCDPDAIARVFTLDGTLVYAGTDREIALTPGRVYIVAIGPKRLKLTL